MAFRARKFRQLFWPIGRGRATPEQARITVAAGRRGPYLRRNPGSKRDATRYRQGVGRYREPVLRKGSSPWIMRLRPVGAFALILLAFSSGACAQDAPVLLVPHQAVYDLSLQKDPRQFPGRSCARPHPLRFQRQCLRTIRWNSARSPRWVPVKTGVIHQRPPLDHLGRRRRQKFQIQLAEFHQRQSGRQRRRPRRAQASRNRGGSRKSPSRRPSISTPRWCFLPSTWCG